MSATTQMPTADVRTIEIPLPSYRALEQHVQEVRLMVLRRAAEQSGAVVTREQISEALQGVAESPKPARSMAKLPSLKRDGYDYLDRRLDGLRLVLLQTAITKANELKHLHDDDALVTPDIVEIAWDHVWGNPAVRRALLKNGDGH